MDLTNGVCLSKYIFLEKVWLFFSNIVSGALDGSNDGEEAGGA